MKNFGLISLSVLLCNIGLSYGIRCFECRSDILRTCGDPFYPGNVPAKQCDQFSVNPTFMCFKASQYVSGSYVTVRGCAPFDTESFGKGMQRSMSGTYWKGFNVFSLCDYDNCNKAITGANLQTGLLLTSISLTFLTKFFQLF